MSSVRSLLFIRHAVAWDRADFRGDDDLQRPLTEKGRKKARRAFDGLLQVYDPPDLIVHSEAERARDTAQILGRVFPSAPLRESALLNPGADYESLLKLLSDRDVRGECVALVGHEPDFSEMISGLLQAGPGYDGESAFAFLHLDIKKASCVEIKLDGEGAGELRNFLSPSVLRLLGKVEDV